MTKFQLKDLSLEQLIKLQAEITKESLSRLEPAVPKTLSNLTQVSRHGIILSARALIRSWEDDKFTGKYRLPGATIVEPTFVVNVKKRTIVCLLKGYTTKKVYRRGIAKCDPGDVFNADIGKAIALARALEYDVPEYLFNVPQPEEIKEGDVVKSKWTGLVYTINTQLARQGKANYAGINSVAAHDGILLDDTDRAEYK